MPSPGDLGALFHKKPALAVIMSKAPATLELVFGAALIIIFISLPVGIYTPSTPAAGSPALP
jgi:peptide/nickel transport system permease protein